MGVLTPFFNLFKPVKTDPAAISKLDENMDIIDTEMHRPPLTVNETEPDENRNITIDVVPLADNLTSDAAQINMGTYIVRASGGSASIADGEAWLSSVRGNQVKTGYVPESLNMTVTPAAREEGEDPISATIDRDTFVEYVTTSGTITMTFTTAWNADPATYGITVTGTPVSGDQIVVVYVKENRGTITTATPTSFISTGWNLYNHAAGYARVVDYSDEYGFMIEGTYTELKFAETLSGEQQTIVPIDGYFTVPSDGFVFVAGGNATDTEIWMTWADWTEEPNDGVFEPYSQTTVDLSGVMVNFPDGLMRIGNYYDEIDLNTQRGYSRVQKLEYTAENLANVIASGVPYDTDAGYIYAVRVAPVTYSISLSGEYTVSDHGTEMFLGTNIDVTATSLYGDDLKGKLQRDVVTISQQTLTSAQQAQIRTNISAASQADVNTLNDNFTTLNNKSFKVLPATTNFNDITTAGAYCFDWVSGGTNYNRPVNQGGLLNVDIGSDTYTKSQHYTDSNGRVFARGYHDGAWTSWQELALKSDIEYYTLLNGEDVTSTLTEVTLYNGRNLANYSKLLAVVKRGYFYRASMFIITGLFGNNSHISLTEVDSSNTQRWYEIKYVSNTKVSLQASSNAGSGCMIYLYGLP